MVTELPTNFQNSFPSLICSLDQILLLPLFLLWQANTHTVKFMRKPFFLLIKKMHSYSFSKAFPLYISRNRKRKNIIKFIQGLQWSEKPQALLLSNLSQAAKQGWFLGADTRLRSHFRSWTPNSIPWTSVLSCPAAPTK